MRNEHRKELNLPVPPDPHPILLAPRPRVQHSLLHLQPLLHHSQQSLQTPLRLPRTGRQLRHQRQHPVRNPLLALHNNLRPGRQHTVIKRILSIVHEVSQSVSPMAA